MPRSFLFPALRAIGALALAALSCFAWLLFWTPLHVTLEHEATLQPVLRVDGQVRQLAVKPLLTLHRVTITNVSTDGATVELALPVPDGSARLPFAGLSIESGQWVSTSHGERVESTQPGSAFSFEIVGAEPELPFVKRPDGGRVRVSSAGTVREFDLRASGIDWQRVGLAPQRQLSTTTLAPGPFGARVAITAIATEAAGSGAAKGRVQLGAGRVIERFALSAGGMHAIEMPPARLAGFAFDALLDFVRIAGWSALLLIGLTLAGSLVLPLTRFAQDGASAWIAACAVGFALVALAANTTAYLVPARTSALPFALLWGLAAFAGAARLARARAVWAGAPAAQRMPLAVPLFAFLGVWLCFWPLGSVGPGYLGTLQPDSSFYASASNMIQVVSLRSAIETGALIGFGMRSIDLALVASLSTMSSLSTGRAWQVLCMALMLLPPLVAWCLVRDWLNDRRAAWLTSLAVALSAPIAGLYLESYLVQYVTTPALYINLLTALPFLRSLDRVRPDAHVVFAHAASSALAVLLYPYFAVVPVATVLLAAWHLRRDRGALRRHVGMLGTFALVAGNVGYVFMLNHGDTGQFVDALNDIARFVVFPFYATPRFPAFLFGLVPFHANPELVGSLAAQSAGHPLAGFFAGYTASFGRYRVLLLVAVIVLAYVLALWRHRARLCDRYGGVLPASLLGYLLMLLVAWKLSGLYAFCKLAWTLATLLPVMLVPALAVAISSRGGTQVHPKRPDAARGLAWAALLVLLCGSAVARIAAPAQWFANPLAYARAYTALAADLAAFESWLERDGRHGLRYVFHESIVRTAKPADADQVLAGQAWSMAMSRGHVCPNCNRSYKLLEFMWFAPIDVQRTDADLLLLIGEPPEAGLPGWVADLEGDRLSVYRRAGMAGSR